MAEFIVMPKLGFDMHEGVLVSWLMEVGDDVKKGDVVAEIESDKATLELEAMSGGVLLKTLANEGDVVPIGGNLAIVGEAGEDIAEMAEQADLPAESESVSEGEEEAVVAPSPVTSPDDSSVSESAVNDEFPGGVKATPVARRVASEHGVSLKDVNGSGPGGRIRKLDVESYLERAAEAPVVAIQPTPVLTGPETTEVPASRLRQAIGRRMAQSKTTIPHFYVTTEVDMVPLLSLRKQINALLPDEHKVSVNDMIVKAAALNLRDFPNLNANFAGDKFIVHNRINIGSAVAVEGGLLTVVQKNTDFTPLAQIAIDNKTMIGRARDGKSRPEDFEGSTFTVSNLGAYDVDHFIAIINPPEAVILAVGTASQVPVVVDGELAVGWRMKATLSADHRVTDGAEAARFLQAFKSIMEEPLRLLL
jgi:pyruvate dehydrogenase E2 component (dihydrolipoamide acetyltransferase)